MIKKITLLPLLGVAFLSVGCLSLKQRAYQACKETGAKQISISDGGNHIFHRAVLSSSRAIVYDCATTLGDAELRQAME
ncbi:MAG: hypothetical protein QM529_07515 [Hydrotalea sp.]|nr:hypothetical protein [Hydrotalea sp.]